LVTLFCFFKRAWWDNVTVMPEDTKIIVFNKGTWKGFNGLTPIGGQKFPISILGASLLWKKAQKKEKKNKISETMKSNIPVRRPFITFCEWYPCHDLSREISRHQRKEVKDKKVILIRRRLIFLVFIHIIIPSNVLIDRLPLNKGHGLGKIIW